MTKFFIIIYTFLLILQGGEALVGVPTSPISVVHMPSSPSTGEIVTITAATPLPSSSVEAIYIYVDDMRRYVEACGKTATCSYSSKYAAGTHTYKAELVASDGQSFYTPEQSFKVVSYDYCGDFVCGTGENQTNCCTDCGIPRPIYNNCCTREYSCRDNALSYTDLPTGSRCALGEYCRKDCTCVGNGCSTYLTDPGCSTDPGCRWCSYEGKCKIANESCAAPTPSTVREIVPDEFLVKIKSSSRGLLKTGTVSPKNSGIASLDALNGRYNISKFEQVAIGGANSRKEKPIFNWYKLTTANKASLEEAMSAYRADQNVEVVEPNYIVHAFLAPNDPYYSSTGAWGQQYPDLWGMKKIDAEQAWSQTTGSPTITVADIDTGVDRNHEDLQGNMWVNAAEIPNNGLDDDGNGYVDDYYGWDWANNDSDPMDDNGHGTHTAGTIAAVGNNSKGVVGVNWKAKIMALKFLNADGSGKISDGASALVYASDKGARVSSNSWGGAFFSQMISDAVQYAHEGGMTVVVAAGNSNADALDFFPAAEDDAITVAASDPNDAKASFSNHGEKIDVAAPGVDILSLRVAGTDIYSRFFNDPNPVPRKSISVVACTQASAQPGAAPTPTPIPASDAQALVDHAFAQGTQDVPDTMCAGEEKLVSVVMKNDGNTTWLPTYSLAPAGGSYNWGVQDIPVGNPSVPPGGIKTFTFTITAPSARGIYYFQWKMKNGGVRFVPQGDPNAKYYRASGTSMATPHVAGLAALILAKNPGLTNEDVRQIIRKGATDFGPQGKDKEFGYGRINAANSISMSATEPLAPVITGPKSRSRITGSVFQVTGSVTGPNFAGYILDAGKGRSPTSWKTLAVSYTQMVNDGVLATVNLADLEENGPYTFRLRALDTSDNVYEYQVYDVINDLTVGDHATTLNVWGVPSFMCTGETKNVVIAMKNTGTRTWTPQYSLAPTTFYGWNASGKAVSNQVPPNMAELFSFPITAPTGPGSLEFQWKMKNATGNFFDEATSMRYVSVVSCASFPTGTLTTPTEEPRRSPTPESTPTPPPKEPSGLGDMIGEIWEKIWTGLRSLLPF